VKHSIREITQEELKKTERLFEGNKNQLELYAELLLWWNTKINLVSRDVSRETVRNHVKHSLFVSLCETFLRENAFLDTGAGGGLPGLPLSICFPEKSFVINDIVTKKIFAVNDMVNKLKMNKSVKGSAGNVRGIDIEKGRVVLTKHAFKIDQLYDLIKEKDWQRIIFLKGWKEAVEEAGRIKESVSVNIIRLDADFMDPFYDGKGVVELVRGEHE
jgi:16S rRNA (guanine527-N7)-methyltransferase